MALNAAMDGVKPMGLDETRPPGAWSGHRLRNRPGGRPARTHCYALFIFSPEPSGICYTQAEALR